MNAIVVKCVDEIDASTKQLALGLQNTVPDKQQFVPGFQNATAKNVNG